jgi:hypothetical protein
MGNFIFGIVAMTKLLFRINCYSWLFFLTARNTTRRLGLAGEFSVSKVLTWGNDKFGNLNFDSTPSRMQGKAELVKKTSEKKKEDEKAEWSNLEDTKHTCCPDESIS